MSSGCGDVLSLEDLKIAKKHQLFEAEVITGLQGGVAGGASIDYATNPITGQTQKTLPAILRDAGFSPASFTFTTGGTLGVNDADKAVLWPVASNGDGNYYAWKGALPKTIPAASSPTTTGGVSGSAWVAVSEAALRSDLASNSGAELVGYGYGSIQSALYHTVTEFDAGNTTTALSSAFSQSGTDGRPTLITGQRSTTAAITLPTGARALNAGVVSSSENGNLPAVWLESNTSFHGGRISNTGRAQALRSEGGDSVISVADVEATGSFVTSSSLPAYAFDFYDNVDLNAHNMRASGYTGGLSLTRTNRAILTALSFRNMVYHPSLVAGGYGVLLQSARNTNISQLFFKSAGDGSGRHALYVSQSGGVGCANTVVNNGVFDYSDEPDATAPPGAINIRANDRAIYGDIIIEGTGITGNTENGNISAQIVHDTIVGKFKHGTTIAYGISLGDDTAGNRVRNCVVANNIITISPRPGAADAFTYAIVCAGQDNAYLGNYTRIPDSGQPYLVRANAANILIQGGLDTGPALGSGLPFIQFDGAASNISILGCKTNRPWFRPGNLVNVTNLTVDFPRSCGVAVSSGAASTSDSWELINSVSVGTSSITIVFNSHVTAAAVAAAIVSDRPSTTFARPQLLSVSNKNLTIQFVSTAGAILNPSTSNVAANITLNS